MTTTKTKIGRQKFAAYAPDETKATALRSKHKANTCVIPLSGHNEMLREYFAASRTLGELKKINFVAQIKTFAIHFHEF